MRLKKLELYGFKSFAQRTEIVFNEGITGIVGPNGSGKSNIADAVRWVLGEQSAKTLRGANMADVIFNGTQKRKPLNYCEVSLIFDNDDRALPMDYAEVVVTRRVYRNGDSEYQLNRSSCRLKDIVDLFRDTGIGREGYSIIGQGRIDEILSRKSEDRRLVFEEAAGIVKFKTRKEEADKKLKNTLENAARIDDILEELNRQLGPLEEQSRTAREYLELSAELKTLDLNLFLIRTDKGRERLQQLETDLTNLRIVLENTAAALTEKALDRDARQETVAKLDAEISQARDELLRLTESYHEAQSRLASLNSRREMRAENRQRLLEEQKASEKRMAELEALAASGAEQTNDKTKLIAGAEAELSQANDAAARCEGAERSAEEALEEHKNEILRQMNRVSAVRNDQTRLRTMRTTMEERLNEITSSGDTMRGEEEQLSAAFAEAEERLEHERQEQNRLSAALDEAEKAAETHDDGLLRMRRSAEEKRSTLQIAESRVKLLQEMTREMEGYNQSVRRAMQYAKQRNLRGVRGVLAQLIEVPKEYETAIDMALGAAQQNIVTDDEQTAKQLIDYLRAGRFGRATFLPINAVRSHTRNDRERQALTMPGCIGVASELIRYDGAYRGVVENLLGRTVIAADLDSGIAIQRATGHSLRLVTLVGDVMHSGGSMTGGSVQSRMVSLLSRSRELREMTDAVGKGREELTKLTADIAEAEKKARELHAAQDSTMEALHQQEIAVAREQERSDRAGAELDAQRGRLQATEDARVQLRESIDEIDRQLNDITIESGTAETDQAAMEERTQTLQQALTAARRQAEDARGEVVRKTLRLSDLRHELESLRRDAGRLENERREADLERERRKKQIEAMDAQDQQDAEQAEAAALEAQDRQKLQQDQETAVHAQEEKRAAEQSRLNDVLRDIENLHASEANDSDRLHRLELQKTRTEGELKQLQDRIWDTYELTYGGAEAFRQTEGFKVGEADRRVAELNGRIRELGPVNVSAMEQYAETKARRDDLNSQLEDLRKAETDLRGLIERLLGQMQTTFVENFTKMQAFFSETFVRLFGGGHAELSLMDPNDPLNCGIEVNVQPPGKKLQLLSLLSDGERALTAIAILFAMLKLKPTPFCIPDEIEAALDEANIGYYADYLKEYSDDTQFIVITHRKGTMERCNALYGVAMEEQGVSKMVSVSLQDYEE